MMQRFVMVMQQQHSQQVEQEQAGCGVATDQERIKQQVVQLQVYIP